MNLQPTSYKPRDVSIASSPQPDVNFATNKKSKSIHPDYFLDSWWYDALPSTSLPSLALLSNVFL